MASLRVLALDHEGRPIQFTTWLDDLQPYQLSDSRDSVSLFDHTSGASIAPPATANSATRSQWLTRDAAPRLAIRNHLPLAECAHIGQHKTAIALCDAVVARYSSPATAALGRLILPYMFPELSAFATVEDLVTHLRTSDARYRAALLAKFLDKNPPPMYITLHFVVTRLPDSLCVVRDHFLALDPTDLIVDQHEQHLLAAETSVVAIGAARGTPRTPFFEGCAPSPLAPSYVSATAVDILGAEDVGAASASGKHRSSKGKGVGGSGGGGGNGSGGGAGALVAAVVAAVGVAIVAAVGVVADGLELLSVDVLAVARGSSSSIGARPRCPSSFVSGLLSVGRLGVEPPDPCIEAGASESALPGTALAEALHTLMLDSGASRCFFQDSTTLTPLSAPVPVRLADPSGGPVLARSSTVLPCPAVPSDSLSGLHLPSFSTKLRCQRSTGDPRLILGKGYRLVVLGGYGRTDPLLNKPFYPNGLPVLRLYSDRGGEFSSDLLREFCRGEGILQLFTLLASPQQNGIAEYHIGLLKEGARTSMIHATAPHFPWPFAVRYAAHQLNLWARVSLPETSYTALDGEGWRCVGVLGLGFSCLCSRYVRGQALRLRYSLRLH
ncbi:unnamed protein product [Closterium sp. NIES-53]